MLLDVMGTSGHAIARAELVRPDIQSIYIADAGPIGLGLLVMAKLRYGADLPVFISDVSPWRLDFAESFGGIPVNATAAGSIAVVGARFKDGSNGFYLLADRADPPRGDTGSAEEILNHFCVGQ